MACFGDLFKRSVSEHPEGGTNAAVFGSVSKESWWVTHNVQYNTHTASMAMFKCLLQMEAAFFFPSILSEFYFRASGAPTHDQALVGRGLHLVAGKCLVFFKEQLQLTSIQLFLC